MKHATVLAVHGEDATHKEPFDRDDVIATDTFLSDFFPYRHSFFQTL